MGINTIVLIHNDAINDIEQNPADFGEELAQAVKSMHHIDRAYVGAGSSANAAHVITAGHSSFDYFVRVHGNTANQVSWEDTKEDDMEAMAAFLESKGYTIQRPGGSNS